MVLPLAGARFEGKSECSIAATEVSPGRRRRVRSFRRALEIRSTGVVVGHRSIIVGEVTEALASVHLRHFIPS
jgi:hypothetical protein